MLSRNKIITVYPNFANQGGAQDIALRLAKQLETEGRPIVLCQTPAADVAEVYRTQAEFRPFNWGTVKSLARKGAIFLSHSRKTSTLLCLYSNLFGRKLHVIHVAHNTFTNLRRLTLFPQTVVAVSQSVKQNLQNYFRQPEEHIQVILNGLPDHCPSPTVRQADGLTKVLLPGRICAVKQQVALVKNIGNNLAPHVHFYFAGTGDDESSLRSSIEGHPQFHFLGHIDMPARLPEFDYVCLFSQKEGLALSLVEGLMFGKPLVTNFLPSTLEVNQPNVTGFAYPDFASLAQGLNSLPQPDTPAYATLSRAARERYQTYFTEPRMIEEYRETIRQVELEANNHK